ncbi:MAG: carbohydrate kinase family protein [Candidatus Woesearchaeota archaeon]
MYDIVTCGSATIDAFAHTDNGLIDIKGLGGEQKLIVYPSGSKLLVKQLEFQLGGGGTNCAYGFKKMGLHTGYIGCVGSRGNATAVMHFLQQAGIDFLGHKTNHQTGYSIILDSIEQDRTILTHKGANDYLDFTKIKKKAFQTKWLYFSSMLGKSFITQKKIAQLAFQKGTHIAFNPSEYQVKQGLKPLTSMLKYITVLIMNKEEFTLLCEQQYDVLHKIGVSVVVITDGGKAVEASDGVYRYVMQPPKVKVVEVTGAGDAFASGFVSAYMKKKDISYALQVGAINSAAVISHFGAKSCLVKKSQISDLLKKYKLVIKKEKIL